MVTFLEETDDAITALAAGPDARGERLHFIKGCARMLGAVRLGGFCEEPESEDFFGPDDLRLLQREFGAFRDELMRYPMR